MSAPLDREMPARQALLWRPATGGSTKPRDDWPIFVARNVLTALAEHAQATVKHGILGFVVGDVCRDRGTGVPFLIADSTIRLNQPIHGDKISAVISKAQGPVMAELAKVGGHLLGWYHSHPPHGIALAPGDVQAHLEHFTQRWQFALVLGIDATGPAAAFYRPAKDALSVTTCLPFREVAETGTVEGKPAKRTAMPWTNFVTADTVVYAVQEAADAARRSAGTAKVQRATLQVIGRKERPKALENLPLIHEEEPPRPPIAPPRPAPQPRVTTHAVPKPRPARRRGRILLVVALLGAVAAAVWYTGFPPLLALRERGAEPPATEPPAAELPAVEVPVVDSALLRLDAFADTLERATASYGERAALFDRRRVACDELQRGLVAVEEGWMAYNARGKARAPALDAARAGRDQALYARVDSVDRHFERSRCVRP